MFGAISGVGIWLSLTFAIAFYLVGLGEYVVQVFRWLAQRFEVLAVLESVPGPVAAAVGGVLLVLLNLIGAKKTGRTQFYIVVVLLAILGVFSVGGLFHIEPANFAPFFPRGTSPIFSTTALVFVSFLGFVKIAAVSEEIKNPDVVFGPIPDVIADQAPCSVLMVRRYLPEHWSFKANEGIKRLREGAGLTTSPEDGRP
ncbi:MAG: hypothetical protein ACNA8W_01090 [Bradymonadaceae bacterium]